MYQISSYIPTYIYTYILPISKEGRAVGGTIHTKTTERDLHYYAVLTVLTVLTVLPEYSNMYIW